MGGNIVNPRNPACIFGSRLAPLRPAISTLASHAFVGLAWLSLLVGCAASSDDMSMQGGTPAYFRVDDGDAREAFVIQLFDPARAIVTGSEKTRVHVMGTVVSRPKQYNPPWHFHLGPDSISFFETAIEVCDATTTYVEAHLAEVGGSFLPNAHWCPWIFTGEVMGASG